MSRESVATILKRKRKDAKLSVDSVIATLDHDYMIQISAKTIYGYESGHRQADADTLLALCEIYKVKDILEEFGYKKEEPTVKTDDQLSVPEEVFMSLPANLRQDVLRYMRFLAEQEGPQK